MFIPPNIMLELLVLFIKQLTVLGGRSEMLIFLMHFAAILLLILRCWVEGLKC